MESNKVSKGERKFRVNTAALVDLKAALYHKQQQVRKEKQVTQDATVAASREVSEKTSSIWKSVSLNDKKSKRKETQRTRQNEKSDQAHQLSAQEEQELAKSRRALEAKAALYDRLRQGVGLREELEGEDGEENETRFMVDFTKKIWQEQQSSEKSDLLRGVHTENEKHDEIASSSGAQTEEEEWVDFVDSLGRSRRCLKKDLGHYQSIDNQLVAERSNGIEAKERSPSPDLLSDDMRRERERKKWEEQAEHEAGLDEPVHYQAVRGGEVRSHGIGYYAFSTDEAKRKEQMDLLDKLRKQTQTQKEKRQKLQEKRKAVLEARLAKVCQRKLKQRGIEDNAKGISGIADFDFETKDKEGAEDSKGAATTPDFSGDISSLLSEVKEQSRAEQEKEAEEKRATHVRPWDKGKVVDPIRKRKQELRDERLTEFAPPSSYCDTAQAEKPSLTKKTKADDDVASTSEGQVTTRTPESTTITPTVPATCVATYGYPPPYFTGTQFPPPPFTGLPPGHYPPPPHGFVPPPYPPGVRFPPPPPQGPNYGYSAPYSYMRPPPPPPPPGVPPPAATQTDTNR